MSIEFDYKGYAGKILRVNLSKKEIKTQPLKKELARNYIGGSGFAIRILYDELKPGIDPLGAENKLFIGTGPLTGTLWANAGRFMVAAKSPLTGIWGESHCGGHFGPELKYAGYDAILIEGISKEPTYLRIIDDEVKLENASHIWGKDVHEACDIILKDLQENAQITCIGQAGENLVRFASIITNYYRAVGRTGMGAVMGSKKLKAIVVKGSKPVEVVDQDKFIELANEAGKRVLAHPQAQAMNMYGTPLLVMAKQSIGELPTKNHYTGIFPNAEALSAETIREKYWKATKACFSCYTMCKKANYVKQSKYGSIFTEGPEYETIMAFGTNCYVDDFNTVLYANLLCDRYGLDTISTGKVISFAMECYEKGIITKEDANGLDLSWGNADTLITLIHKIAKREGFGNILAEGVRKASSIIGKGSEKYAMHVKGLEISGQDGRTHRSVALTHAVNNRGADHLRSLVTVDQLGYEETAKERWGSDKLPEICDPYSERYKALAVYTCENVYAIRDSLIVCWYTVGWPPIFWIEDFAKVLPLVTGEFAFSNKEELIKIGERIVNLERCFNVREGISVKDDTLPDRFIKEPMPEGPGKGQVANLKIMLEEYYLLRGWENGIPKLETLKRLELFDAAEELIKTGKIKTF
ncbi:MAG: aldehyde ferredoxin oxidoreductase family protein [Candidatus Bathyarchaeia archaeon]